MANTVPSRVVDYAEAAGLIHEQADSLLRTASRVSETLPLLECIGRVLAEPVRADSDQPPFARSTRDGFACRSADLLAGHRLRVVGQVKAGEEATRKVSPGEAIEIMTGAPVPSGADCVVMLEHVEHLQDAMIALARDPLPPGSNIVPQGAEAQAGNIVLPAGTRMGAAQIGAAAACGAATLTVFQPPRVAVIATGDELVELDQRRLPYQIRNSNSYSLTAQILACNGKPVQCGIARDDRRHLEVLIRNALQCDLVLLSGGVSAGKHDLVEEVLLSLGAEFFFNGARIQPGRPIVFGRFTAYREKYFFGLPGNPVSTMVTFSLFVEPLLDALGGQAPLRTSFVQAKLGENYEGKSGLARFLPAILSTGCAQAPIEPAVVPIAWHGSGDLASTSRANCFLVVPADRASLTAGETVSVLLMKGGGG